jgi:hypothetical protein
MQISILIARFLGPFFIVVALGILFNLKYYQKVMEDFFKNTALLYVGGIIALLLGIFLVMFNNFWVLDWTLIITIIGWLSIVKGICLIVLPQAMAKISKAMMKNTAILVVHLIVVFAIGVALLVKGYSV